MPPEENPGTDTQDTGNQEPTTQQPSIADSPEYKGLQRTLIKAQTAIADRDAKLKEATDNFGTLQEQYVATQAAQVTLKEQVDALTTKQSAADAEAQFWNMIGTDYPGLIAMAPYIARDPDAEKQKAILDAMTGAVGSQVTQVATQQVQQQFRGVTPGASPPVGASGGAQQYSKEHILTMLDLTDIGSKEHREWAAVWEQHPESGPPLGADGQPRPDPLANDWEQVMTQAPGTQRVPTHTALGPFARSKGG